MRTAIERSQRILDSATREENLRTARFARETARQLPIGVQRRLAEEVAEWFEARAAAQERDG